MFWGFVHVFSFQTLMKGKYLSILWFVTCYCLKMAHNNFKFTKKLDAFANSTVDDTQKAFYKN